MRNTRRHWKMWQWITEKYIHTNSTNNKLIIWHNTFWHRVAANGVTWKSNLDVGQRCQKIGLSWTCFVSIVAHAPGMLGTVSLPPRIREPDKHVPWSLTSGFLWNRWRGNRSWHCRRMHNPQFYVSGKRPMAVRCPGAAFDNGYYLGLWHA